MKKDINNSKYKAVLFDLDGTLIDTVKDLAEAANHALVQMGKEADTLEEHRARLGWGLKMLIVKSMPGESEEHIEKTYALFTDYYKKNSCVHTDAYEGIRKMLQQLSEAGLDLFVYTNKAEDVARDLVEHIFGKGLFKEVFGALDTRPMKPHKEGVDEVIAATGYDREEILYVGDSEVDMETALAGGLDCLAVLWGFRTEEQLTDFPKLAYVRQAEEILKIIFGDHIADPDRNQL